MVYAVKIVNLEVNGSFQLFRKSEASVSQYLIVMVRLDLGEKEVCEMLDFSLECSNRLFGERITHFKHLCIATNASLFPVSSA